MYEGIFRAVLAANRVYVESVEANESAEEQERKLKDAGFVFKRLVKECGLLSQYDEFCRRLER